jgi:hypothetical protein
LIFATIILSKSEYGQLRGEAIIRLIFTTKILSKSETWTIERRNIVIQKRILKLKS